MQQDLGQRRIQELLELDQNDIIPSRGNIRDEAKSSSREKSWERR